MTSDSPEPLAPCILVDDEAAVRTVLRSALSEFPQLNVAGEAANVQEAVKLIHRHQPELVFLDIEMPGYSGLQLLDFFNEEEINFEIIFVTAYDEYAIQAFKLSAFDYLLKPIDEEQLAQTLERYFSKRDRKQTSERFGLLKSSYRSEEPAGKIAISATYGVEFINIPDILFLEAQSNYTRIVVKPDREIIASKSLNQFESILAADQGFFRTHRSYLINVHHVAKLSLKEGTFIEMEGGHSVPLSRVRRKDFDALYAQIKI